MPPDFLHALALAGGVVVLLMTMVVDQVRTIVLVAITPLMIVRVGVGAVTVTTGAVDRPDRTTIGLGVIVTVTSDVDVTVRVEASVVTVELT
jgi:hypothetical protein